jgi:hypothetical protein
MRRKKFANWLATMHAPQPTQINASFADGCSPANRHCKCTIGHTLVGNIWRKERNDGCVVIPIGNVFDKGKGQKGA